MSDLATRIAAARQLLGELQVAGAKLRLVGCEWEIDHLPEERLEEVARLRDALTVVQLWLCRN